MIAVPTESRLLAPEDSQPALCRFCSLGLAGTLLAEKTGLDFFPVAFAEKRRVTGNGGTVDAKIDADGLLDRPNLGGRRFDDNVQKESSIPMNKIGRADFAFRSPREHGRKAERNRDASFRGRQPHGMIRPVHRASVDVVARRAHSRMWAGSLPPLLTPCEGRLDGLRCLDASLNMKIAHQSREM